MSLKSKSVRGKIGFLAVPLLLLFVLCLMGSPAGGQTLYDITFNQFTPGTIYTTATGPPNDFTSYVASGAYSNEVTSSIATSYLGLTNQPLVCNVQGFEGIGAFSMSLGNVSSNVVTLNMQLMLDSTVGAGVGFGGQSGSLTTDVGLSFPGISTNSMTVNSYDGFVFDAATLYSASTNLNRGDVQNVQFSINTLAHTFDLMVNNITLAMNAPFGSSAPITQVGISIGDLSSQEVTGEAGIDNILVTASAIPEAGTLTLVALAMPLILLLYRRRETE